jgi:histidine triad (HIT) family protein
MDILKLKHIKPTEALLALPISNGVNMPTVFTKILSGEIPAHKILENEKYLAFLDIRPVNPGHTLVIPKQEIDYIFDIDDELLKGLIVFSKKVAKAIKKTIPCKKVGVMVAGLEVPHAHVHLIPILENLSELNFARAKSMPLEELSVIAARIRSNLK